MIRRYQLARALANINSLPVVSADDLRDAEWRHLNAPAMAFLYEDESTRPPKTGTSLVETVRSSARQIVTVQWREDWFDRLAFTLDEATGRVAIWRTK